LRFILLVCQPLKAMNSSLPSRNLVLTFAVSWLLCQSATSQNISDTRLLGNPAVSAERIAFIYAEDLWTADLDGSNPRRITIDEGVERNPVFSPDGSLIAFTAEYDGNLDVFVVPAGGGVPKRLTWHPGWDMVQDFTPDGQSVVFTSGRLTHTNRHAKLYTVSIEGGQPQELPIPTVFMASFSEDGETIAYNPTYEVFNQWKHYRGGTQARIWIYDRQSHEVTEVPKPESGSNDANPQWIGERVFFRSDRNGEFNLYSYNVNTRAVEQHTSHEDFPVVSLTTHGQQLIYEQAGYLHLFNSSTGTSTRLVVGIATDLLEKRPRYVSGNNYIRSAAVSPSGARAVLDFRGEIVTVPAEKGDAKNLTQTTGVHEKYPSWSPDGNTIAYFSDASGEYALHIRDLEENSVRKFDLPGAGFYAYIHWSPDSKNLCFVDNSRSLFLTDVASGATKKIASDSLYTPGVFRELFGSWSPDSRWFSYTRNSDSQFNTAFIYQVDQAKSYQLTDGMSNVTEAVFDPSGKYVYLLASTDAGPVINWFDQSNQDMELTNSIYLVTLQKDTPSPLAKESDEEADNEEENDEEKDQKDEKDDDEKEKVPEVKIDWEGITQRIVDLPVKPGQYSGLSCAEEGKLYYLAAKPHAGYNDPGMVKLYDLEDREEKEIMEANWFTIASGGNKWLYRKGKQWTIAEIGKEGENGGIKTSIQVKIDPEAEWDNIFNEAWRVNRDYFYDPGMHGADWDTLKVKYRQFLRDVSCRSDLYRVMSWMFSELAVGHHRFSGTGDKLNKPEKIKGGLLGADYQVANNRYQIGKIYGGLNWTPELRSPLTEPGVTVNQGDYLLSVDDKEVTADQNLYQFFENTADKIVMLRVGPNPDGTGAREVKVVPVANEYALRNRDWVEGNIKKVEEATNGQVAYVYVPNTTTAGHQYFKRYFFPQADKQAVIIDERYNGGGQLADYYIDILKKPLQSYWNFRYGKDLKAPSASIQGPKVMITDETAGSGGDYLPFLFRKFELGPIVGKRTWGGLVGVLGFPEFIDGGSVTAPNVAFWDENGYGIENVGVPPDIEVEQWPKEVIAGGDPQLEKAIEVVMEALKSNPPEELSRPEYPVRVK